MSRVLLFAAALLFAGCVTPATDVDPQAAASGGLAADWWETAIPNILLDPKHDHSLRAQHQGLTTSNFEVLGWDPLLTESYGTSLVGMGCGGAVAREDGRKLAVVHSIATDVSFVVADVTDPAAPMMMGEFYMPNAVVWDADISADGMHVLIGAYPYAIFGDAVPVLPGGVVSAPEVPLRIEYRNACTGETSEVGPINYLPFGPGIVMVGIADPAAPVFEDWVSQPAVGPHSVGSQMIDGTVYATSSVTNLQHEGSYYTIFEIIGPKLVPVSVIQTPGVYAPAILTNGHTDVFLQKHPVTGALLAHLANWDGYYIVDLSIPAVPMIIAEWFDAGNVHTTYPFPTMWGEKQYILVGQEVGEPEERPTGWIYILDITDPTAPTEVGRWTLPAKFPWTDVNEGGTGLLFSPHYVSILNTTMFVSNYHGGLWAVDITDPTAPAAIGIFVPDRESSAPYGGAESYGPSIEDVIVDPLTGILTTWDGAGGVYNLRFNDMMAMVPAPAWPAP